MTRLYLSGPMTHYPEHNFPAFAASARSLRGMGYEVDDPSDKGVLDGWTWADYLRTDLEFVLRCDGVAVLHNWEFSRGAQLEVHVARELGKPVRPVLDWIGMASLTSMAAQAQEAMVRAMHSDADPGALLEHVLDHEVDCRLDDGSIGNRYFCKPCSHKAQDYVEKCPTLGEEIARRNRGAA